MTKAKTAEPCQHDTYYDEVGERCKDCHEYVNKGKKRRVDTKKPAGDET